MSVSFKKTALRAFTAMAFDRACMALHRSDALVLVYHGIFKEEKPEPFRYHHTSAELEGHLDWLNAHCTPVTLTEFGRWKRGEWKPAKPPVLVTFDDGYRNNATVAAPLLTRKGVPALFFVASGYIGGDRVLWPDEVFARICAWTSTTLDAPISGATTLAADRTERESAALSVVEECKNVEDVRRREFIAYLRRETPNCDPCQDREAQGFMSWDDVRSLGTAGFDLGSHTTTHPILANLTPDDLPGELAESRAAVEAHTGRPCIALAYPNGRSRDIGANVIAQTAAAGYEYAFTVSNRWCTPNADPLQLDRISPPGHADRATFAVHASGARQWLTSAKGSPR